MSEYATSARGDRTAYDRHGDRVSPAVVFIAGANPWRGDDPTTTETARLLATRGVTAIVPDRLGRGESRVDDEEHLDLDRQLDAIAALIDASGGPAVLVGHSSGCAIALAAAARGLPVAGVVAFEAPLGDVGGGADEWSAETRRIVGTGDREKALGNYMRDLPPMFLEFMRSSGRWDAYVDQSPSLLPDGDAIAWAQSAPRAELLGAIDAPVLALVGAETFPGMVEAAREIAESAPRAEHGTVAGAAHQWRPDAMAELLATFVDRIRATSSTPHDASGRPSAGVERRG